MFVEQLLDYFYEQECIWSSEYFWGSRNGVIR